MSDFNKYKSIAVIDVNGEEKWRRQLPTFDIMPIWRWFWHQMKQIQKNVDFLKIDFNTEGKPQVPMKCYDLILVYIEHYIPKWLSVLITKIQSDEEKTDVFLCGFLPTIKPEKILNMLPAVDMILSGPLEISLTQFCKKLYSKEKDSLTVETSYNNYPKEGIILKELQTEYQKKFLPSSVGIIQASAGCPRTCSFCRYSVFYHKFYPGMYKQYSMKEVVSEIRKLVEDYNIHYFRLVDSNFLGSGKLIERRAEEFAEALKKNNLQITYAMHCRSDSLTEDVVKTLSFVGLKYVSIGIESMSDRQLERFGKQETVEDHKKAVDILNSHDVSVQGYAILADPLITRDELLENLKGLYELNQKILIVINEKMILYTTTNYYKKYEKEVQNKKPVETSLGVVVEYDFCDEWCNKNFKYIEQANIWMQKMLIQKYYNTKQKKAAPIIQKATAYRLEAFIAIVSLDNPDDEAVEKIKAETIEKMNHMM